MKKKGTWKIRLAAFCLAGTCLAAGAVALAAGDQSDPLVTLSYLTGKVTPEIMTQVDAKLSAREKALTDQLNAAINAYSKTMEDKLAAGGGGKSAAFAVVDLAPGQKLYAGMGCELMLRVGTVSCFASTSPALINMTDGSHIWDGNALKQNHLYMATIEGRGVVAKDTVKLLVRGSYTIG